MLVTILYSGLNLLKLCEWQKINLEHVTKLDGHFEGTWLRDRLISTASQYLTFE